MRSYYYHFKKTTAKESEQVVNTDQFGEKIVFIPMGIKKRKKENWQGTLLLPPLQKDNSRKKVNKW